MWAVVYVGCSLCGSLWSVTFAHTEGNVLGGDVFALVHGQTFSSALVLFPQVIDHQGWFLQRDKCLKFLKIHSGFTTITDEVVNSPGHMTDRSEPP